MAMSIQCEPLGTNILVFADLFPLGLSIATLILLSFLSVHHLPAFDQFTYFSPRLTADLSLDNAYTGRAQTEIGIFGILSIFWLCLSPTSRILKRLNSSLILAFNAFSTSRWAGIPLHCDSIPAGEVQLLG